MNYHDTAPSFGSVFFPGAVVEPTTREEEVTMPMPAFKMLMAMANAAYASGMRVVPEPMEVAS